MHSFVSAFQRMSHSIQQLLNRLSLRQLQVFQAVYEQQGFGRAAELLGLTQPAVSAQVRQLETALGVTLFEFVGRRLFVTSAGIKVADSVSIIFDQLATLQNEISALEGQITGELRFAAVSTAQYVVPYLLKPFLEKYPAVSVTVNVVNRARAIDRLTENRDDLVVMGIVPTEKPLSSIPFLDNELIPILPPEHPLLTQAELATQRFLDAGLIVREPGSGSRLALEQHCHQQRLRLSPAMELGSNDTIKHAVIAGLGVAILPKLSVLSELKLGTLCTLPLEGFPLRRSWCLVYPSSKSPSLAARCFIAFVQENLHRISEEFRLRSSA